LTILSIPEILSSKWLTRLKMRATKKVYCACTHAVLSGNAVERIDKSNIYELVVTDSIPLGEKKNKKLKDKAAFYCISSLSGDYENP